VSEAMPIEALDCREQVEERKELPLDQVIVAKVVTLSVREEPRVRSLPCRRLSNSVPSPLRRQASATEIPNSQERCVSRLPSTPPSLEKFQV
jgi:hypothetical protein